MAFIAQYYCCAAKLLAGGGEHDAPIFANHSVGHGFSSLTDLDLTLQVLALNPIISLLFIQEGASEHDSNFLVLSQLPNRTINLNGVGKGGNWTSARMLKSPLNEEKIYDS
jgi:hypothetical protein